MAHKPAGGIKSRQVHPQGVRYGERATKINVKGVAQIGSAMGDHITSRSKVLPNPAEPVRGGLKPAGSPGGIPLGNQITGNVGAGAPGAGRTIYKTGTQHGLTTRANAPKGRSFDD